MVVSNDTKDVLSVMRLRVQEQGDMVRKLKADNASEAEIKYAIEELKARKKLLEAKEMELNPPLLSFDRSKLEDLLKQRFFYDQSFSIYGGVQGLYDFGPMGCAIKSNLLSAWRQHFVLEDHLLEVDCSMLTPFAVLQSSGHVDRFTDLMVRDTKTGECFRADHLIKACLQEKETSKKTSEAEKAEIRQILIQLDNFGKAELDDIIRRYAIKSPTTNNELSEAHEFNLMFATMIGPTGQCKGFLRPETAQGIFVNFQRLLQFNQGRIPFGAAQIGSAFRNEISPRSGLIRVREFTMAEIEYFVDPRDKRHPKFNQVRDMEMTFYSACDQLDGKAPRRQTIGEAVDQGMVANETLGYFMARIYQFLLMIGVDEKRLRFRQHLSNEMAHYACDCWDAECQTSYGWIECVGCADRSCYDLTQHAKATGARLVAEKRLSEPRVVRTHECVPNKQALGKAFRGEAKTLIEHLSQLSLDDKMVIAEQLSNTGQAEVKIGDNSYELDSSMVQLKEKDVTLHVEEIVPNVIEPSFGIGRVMYAVFEHSFRVREGDEQRTYLSIPPLLAPYKCSVLPLSNHPDFLPFVQKLSTALTRHGVSHRVDESSGSIGRRYARTDQIAIPYGITIDFDTVNKSPASATLRERDSMKQIRVPLDELPSLVSDLSNGVLCWTDAQTKYPSFEQQETVHSSIAADPELVSKKGFYPLPNDEEVPAGTDEWQSVSEDLEELNKRPDQDLEQWSSATETAETEVLVDGVPPKPVSDDRLLKDMDKVETKESLEAAPNPPHTLPLTWEECSLAVQRHFQAIRARVKAEVPESTEAPSTWTTEADPLNHTSSGYEADQEDNVASRSVGEPIPSPNRELDTFGELSPALHSLTDAADGKASEPYSSESEHPKQPYHGLFVGEGWPKDSSKSEKKSKTEKVTIQPPTSTPCKPYSEKTHNEGWPSVLAKLSEQSCVPELWQFPTNVDATDAHLLSEQMASTKGGQLDAQMDFLKIDQHSPSATLTSTIGHVDTTKSAGNEQMKQCVSQNEPDESEFAFLDNGMESVRPLFDDDEQTEQTVKPLSGLEEVNRENPSHSYISDSQNYLDSSVKTSGEEHNIVEPLITSEPAQPDHQTSATSDPVTLPRHQLEDWPKIFELGTEARPNDQLLPDTVPSLNPSTSAGSGSPRHAFDWASTVTKPAKSGKKKKHNKAESPKMFDQSNKQEAIPGDAQTTHLDPFGPPDDSSDHHLTQQSSQPIVNIGLGDSGKAVVNEDDYIFPSKGYNLGQQELKPDTTSTSQNFEGFSKTPSQVEPLSLHQPAEPTAGVPEVILAPDPPHSAGSGSSGRGFTALNDTRKASKPRKKKHSKSDKKPDLKSFEQVYAQDLPADHVDLTPPSARQDSESKTEVDHLLDAGVEMGLELSEYKDLACPPNSTFTDAMTHDITDIEEPMKPMEDVHSGEHEFKKPIAETAPSINETHVVDTVAENAWPDWPESDVHQTDPAISTGDVPCSTQSVELGTSDQLLKELGEIAGARKSRRKKKNLKTDRNHGGDHPLSDVHDKPTAPFISTSDDVKTSIENPLKELSKEGTGLSHDIADTRGTFSDFGNLMSGRGVWGSKNDPILGLSNAGSTGDLFEQKINPPEESDNILFSPNTDSINIPSEATIDDKAVVCDYSGNETANPASTPGKFPSEPTQICEKSHDVKQSDVPLDQEAFRGREILIEPQPSTEESFMKGPSVEDSAQHGNNLETVSPLKKTKSKRRKPKKKKP